MKEHSLPVSMNDSSFFRKAYHNLRNPIVVVKGYTALMLEGCGGELTDDQHEWITDMKRNSDHLLDLINALSELSSLEAGITEEKPAELDLRAMVKEIIGSFSPLIEEKKLRVSTSLLEPLPRYHGDEHLILTAFRALVQNALIYSPNEGAIEISLKSSPERVSLMVKDSGPGVEHPSHIFEGFYRGELPVGTDYKGTGLGLVMARKIADLYGGSLSLESSPEGSLFCLVLKRKINTL